MTKISSERELAIEFLKFHLQSSAENGLGRRHNRPAVLDLQVRKRDLDSLTPDQISGGVSANLASAIWNLMECCGDHGWRGGRNVEISVKSRIEADDLIVEVADKGPGISCLNKQKTKVEASIMRRNDHSDLAMAVKDARGLGGNVFAENILNGEGNVKGARFSIVIPHSRKEETESF